MRFINFDDVLPDPLAEIQVSGKKYKVMPKNLSEITRLMNLENAFLNAKDDVEKGKFTDQILDEYVVSIDGLDKDTMLEKFNPNHYSLIYMIYSGSYDYGDTPQGNLTRQQKTLPKPKSNKKVKKKKK
jgi:hypothetical protein